MPVRLSTALVFLLLLVPAAMLGYFVASGASEQESTLPAAPTASNPQAGPASPAAGIADIDIDTLFERMNENGAAVRSGHLLLRTERTSFPPGREPATGTVEGEIWFDGTRVRIETRDTGPRSEYSVTSAFDGQQLTEIRTTGPQRLYASVSEAADLGELAPYLDFGIRDLLIRWPLMPAISRGEPHGARLATRRVWLPRLLGEERVVGLSCLRIVLLQQGNDPETTTYESVWVAPDRGHAAAKFERHNIVRTGEDRSAYGDVWQAEEWIHSIEGLWLPSITTWRRYEQGSTSENTHCGRTEIISAEFNIPIPDDVFHLEVPENAEPIAGPRDRAQGRGRGGRSGAVRGAPR